MAAYVIVDLTVTDLPTMEEYRKRVPATLAAYGGRFLVRGGFEGEEQRLPVREVAVERPARDLRRGGDVSHRGTVAPGQNTRRGLEDRVSPCRGPSSRGHSRPLLAVQLCYTAVT